MKETDAGFMVDKKITKGTLNFSGDYTDYADKTDDGKDYQFGLILLSISSVLSA